MMIMKIMNIFLKPKYINQEINMKENIEMVKKKEKEPIIIIKVEVNMKVNLKME